TVGVHVVVAFFSKCLAVRGTAKGYHVLPVRFFDHGRKGRIELFIVINDKVFYLRQLLMGAFRCGSDLRLGLEESKEDPYKEDCTDIYQHHMISYRAYSGFQNSLSGQYLRCT